MVQGFTVAGLFSFSTSGSIIRRMAPYGRGWDSLTRAELRVAELVAEGLTNPAIAERLFVSRNTVQTHLRNVFRKLGVNSRAQVAVEVVLRRPAEREPVDVSRPSTGRILHRGPGFALGMFRCRPGDPRWVEENWIGYDHHVVFPRKAVLIRRARGDVVADPNVVVLYDAGETYRRAQVDPAGDECAYAEIDAGLMEQFVGSSVERPFRFPRAFVPIDARLYALQWSTVATLTGAYERDCLASDERILALLGHVVRSAFEPRDDLPGDAVATVSKAKRVLAERLGEPLSVAEVAAEVPISPYHLIRLFRRETGMTLHRYRTHLRLRASLDRLAHRDEPIASIARSLGFSSHSHFTDRFMQVFGIAPSDVRRASSPAPQLCGVLVR